MTYRLRELKSTSKHIDVDSPVIEVNESQYSYTLSKSITCIKFALKVYRISKSNMRCISKGELEAELIMIIYFFKSKQHKIKLFLISLNSSFSKGL